MSAGSAIFCYDANGYMTQKIAGSSTNYTYDAENNMVSVSGAATATFVYDGDGNRVKGVVGGVTTTYIGNYFEWSPSGKPTLRVQAGSTSTMKKYYYAGGTRVAERVGTLSTSYYFLLTDHLGSTSITATRTGGFSSELRYKAWGETRYSSGSTPTTFRYTGQREESSLGLYWYASRWYSPGLGRFVSPDTIIPQPGNPQAWDRYSYGYNNPISFIDPSGHFSEDQLNNWFCNGKEGCDWRNQFDEFWQKILLKGELGDALAYSWHEGNPVFAVFALQDGMLIGWDLNSKTAQSVPGLASKSQNERLALYRSQNANLDGGPTQSSFWPISNIWIENTNLLLANYNGANHYLYVSGWGGGNDNYDLPGDWYQGSAGAIRSQTYQASFAIPGIGAQITGIAAIAAMVASRTPLLPAFGGPVGLAAFTLDLASLSTWDTDYYYAPGYWGSPKPVPTP